MHQSAPPSSLPLSNSQSKQYRKAKTLPPQVLEHCTFCIEEKLYSQAYGLLTNCVTAGTGDSTDARLPPAQHITLAATLAVHPLLTTRTTSVDKHSAADDALAYLKLVNELIGPIKAGLDKAFLFGDIDLSSSRTGKRAAKPQQSDPNNGDDEHQLGHIRSSFALKESLWAQTEDFWSVVGWAFNCSVAYPSRWERWRLWLEFMLDVLEDDLEIRVPAATRACEARGGTETAGEVLKDSLFARFLAPIGEGRNNKRRLMRAVLTDGGKVAMAEFVEVWKGETKTPKIRKEEPVSKRRKLDLENGQYGDYFDDESEGDSPGADSLRRSRSTTAFSTSRRSRPQSRQLSSGENSEDELHGTNTPIAAANTTSTATSSLTHFGGASSLAIRKRLLALLTRFATVNPDAFLDTEDLFDLYTEFLRPLPLHTFTAFVLPSTPWLGRNSQASLVQMLLRPLLAGTAPAYNENELTVQEFGKFYAPFAAGKTGAVENARVGACVEALVRLLWEAGALEGQVGKREGVAFRELVERGIRERRERAGWEGRKKVGSRAREEEEAVKVLEASAERVLAVLDLAGLGKAEG